jgi:threonylcarbamoyladenosine tRNA methylthiotransferase MtaB
MKIFLDSIGCRLNQAEIESLAGQFRLAGHEIVATAGEADLAVVNTCTVTGAAAADSRTAVRRANRLGAGQVVVTGCWATVEPRAAAVLPGVQKIVPNLRKEALVADLLNLPQEFFDLEPLARQPLPGLRGRTRAFIKVQDGCDLACSFCLTAAARGSSRSRSVAPVLLDIQRALAGGVEEIVLTGVQLGAWGLDFEAPGRLGDLIAAILARTAVPRLRLSSLEPWDLEAGFFDLWQDPRLCRHLHLPLQSGSAAVLRRMRRRVTPASFSALIRQARQAIPDLAVTTDVIAGFPGESQAEFEETLAFLEAMEFAGGHVFTYSARPGTPASRMRNQVPHPVRKQRNEAAREALGRSAARYRACFLGQTLPVLFEATSRLSDAGWQVEGLTPHGVRVFATSNRPLWNIIAPVQIRGLTGDGLAGQIASE